MLMHSSIRTGTAVVSVPPLVWRRGNRCSIRPRSDKPSCCCRDNPVCNWTSVRYLNRFQQVLFFYPHSAGTHDTYCHLLCTRAYFSIVAIPKSNSGKTCGFFKGDTQQTESKHSKQISAERTLNIASGMINVNDQSTSQAYIMHPDAVHPIYFLSDREDSQAYQ